MKCAYQLEFNSNIIQLGVISFVICLIIFLICRVAKRLDMDKPKEKKFVLICYGFQISILLVTTIIILLGIIDYLVIDKAYKNKNYEMVEGYVSNFETSDVDESFTVQNQDFYYRSTYAGAGYHLIKKDGGVIIGNGQRIAILYYKAKDACIILEIWIEPFGS